jgi:pseudouridine kinase
MTKPVICIGAAHIDELFHVSGKVLLATTSDATITKTAGGVSRNIAHQLSILDVPVQLISVFGNDSDGDWVKEICTSAGVKLDASLTIEGGTGKYTGILNADGSLFTAFLTNSNNHLITPDYLNKNRSLLESAFFILADANLTKDTIDWLLRFSNSTGIKLIIEPVSVPPASKLASIDLHGLYLVTPNEDELPVLSHKPATSTKKQIEEILQRGVEYVWLHNGVHGSTIAHKDKTISLHASLVDVKDCTGAGDGSLSGFILGKYLGMDDMSCLKLAHTLAAEILQVDGAIATHLTQEKLLSLVSKYYPE